MGTELWTGFSVQCLDLKRVFYKVKEIKGRVNSKKKKMLKIMKYFL